MKKLIVLMFSIVLLGSCQKDKNLPVLSTVPVVYNYGNTAETGGVISSDGGSDITLRGVCWSTAPNPTIDDDTTINGRGTGNFSSIILNLAFSSNIYIRAYATNSNGTGYGNEINITTDRIGEFFQGGFIFYEDGNGGGLIVAPSDQTPQSVSSGVQWGCNGTLVGADGYTIGTGEQNTSDIIAGCSETNIAAYLCDTCTLGGYSDWFLPSIDELSLIKENLALNGNGNFDSVWVSQDWRYQNYWSSTEHNEYLAWLIGMGPNQNTARIDKFLYYTTNYGGIKVRAIRAF